MIIWEAIEDAEVAAKVAALLAAAVPVVELADPIDAPVPVVPLSGAAQVAVLSTKGILTGRGPYAALSGDPVAGPASKAAFELMTTLMARAEATRPS